MARKNDGLVADRWSDASAATQPGALAAALAVGGVRDGRRNVGPGEQGKDRRRQVATVEGGRREGSERQLEAARGRRRDVTFGAGAEAVGVGQAAALPGWVWSAGRRSGKEQAAGEGGGQQRCGAGASRAPGGRLRRVRKLRSGSGGCVRMAQARAGAPSPAMVASGSGPADSFWQMAESP